MPRPVPFDRHASELPVCKWFVRAQKKHINDSLYHQQFVHHWNWPFACQFSNWMRRWCEHFNLPAIINNLMSAISSAKFLFRFELINFRKAIQFKYISISNTQKTHQNEYFRLTAFEWMNLKFQMIHLNFRIYSANRLGKMIQNKVLGLSIFACSGDFDTQLAHSLTRTLTRTFAHNRKSSPRQRRSSHCAVGLLPFATIWMLNTNFYLN